MTTTCLGNTHEHPLFQNHRVRSCSIDERPCHGRPRISFRVAVAPAACLSRERSRNASLADLALVDRRCDATTMRRRQRTRGCAGGKRRATIPMPDVGRHRFSRFTAATKRGCPKAVNTEASSLRSVKGSRSLDKGASGAPTVWLVVACARLILLASLSCSHCAKRRLAAQRCMVSRSNIRKSHARRAASGSVRSAKA
jgi:hypothetical protein